MRPIQKSLLAVALVGALLTAGCGSSSGSKTGNSSTSSTASSGSSSQSTAGAGPAAGPLSADARSAATGDIPDTQVFLAFSNKADGYSIKYPEGWTQNGSAHDTRFRDKNNLIRVVIASGAAPTPESVSAQLTALKRSNPTISFHPPTSTNLGAGPAVKTVYTTQSAPNPVTGKRVTLVVDRYELIHAGRVATIDLGTPVGVDNVDAYRMIINSFRWR